MPLTVLLRLAINYSLIANFAHTIWAYILKGCDSHITALIYLFIHTTHNSLPVHSIFYILITVTVTSSTTKSWENIFYPLQSCFFINSYFPNVSSSNSAAISLLQTRIRLSSLSSFPRKFMLPYQTTSRSTIQ